MNPTGSSPGLSAVAVTGTELLFSQVCCIPLVMYLSGACILIVFWHDAIIWQVFSELLFKEYVILWRKEKAAVIQTHMHPSQQQHLFDPLGKQKFISWILLVDAIFASLCVLLKGEQILENNWSTLSSPNVGCQLIGALYLPLSFFQLW